MSYDICKTFHSTSVRDNSLRKYRFYALYAYGAPLLMVIISVIIDLAAPEANVSPGFGDNGFWFANRGGLILFFVGPTELLFFCNMAMLVVKIYNIFQHQKNSRFARINNNKEKPEKKKEKGFTSVFLLSLLTLIVYITSHPVPYAVFMVHVYQGFKFSFPGQLPCI